MQDWLRNIVKILAPELISYQNFLKVSWLLCCCYFCCRIFILQFCEAFKNLKKKNIKGAKKIEQFQRAPSEIEYRYKITKG